MKVSSLTLSLGFALAFLLLSSSAHGDQLRKGSSGDDDISRSQQFDPFSSSEGLSGDENMSRSQQFDPFSSFLAFITSLFNRIIAQILAFPTAFAEFLRFVWFLIWNFLVNVFFFLLSPITSITRTTTTTTTTPPVSTTASFPPTTAMTTSTQVTSATTGTGAGNGTMMSTTPAVSTEATSMSSSASSVASTAATSSTSTETTTTTMATTTTTMTTTTTTMSPPKTVFATSTVTNGDMGGVEGGDMMCANAAMNGNLTGEFLAWLSNDTVSPLTRFTKSTGPYVMVSGATFANSYAALISGSGIMDDLDIDETGQPLTSPALLAWTGTLADGTSAVQICANWNNDDMFASGRSGTIESISETWTFGDLQRCNSLYHLYCFEQ